MLGSLHDAGTPHDTEELPCAPGKLAHMESNYSRGEEEAVHQRQDILGKSILVLIIPRKVQSVNPIERAPEV